MQLPEQRNPWNVSKAQWSTQFAGRVHWLTLHTLALTWPVPSNKFKRSSSGRKLKVPVLLHPLSGYVCDWGCILKLYAHLFFISFLLFFVVISVTTLALIERERRVEVVEREGMWEGKREKRKLCIVRCNLCMFVTVDKFLTLACLFQAVYVDQSRIQHIRNVLLSV